MIELALLLAWLFTHAVYRGAVGTVCTFKKIDPPWVRSRQERLTNREVRRADRKAVLESKRTARGFIARLWGDLWQDAHAWQDESREAKQKRREEQPEGKPVVSVDADQAAEWARDLIDKIKAGWNRWWGPSQKQCPWLTMVLSDDHTHVEGRACGQHVRRKDTYCLPHQTFADLGHCLRGNGSPDIPPCMSPRHGHYPFCLPHVEEWGNDTADREAAAPSPEPAPTPSGKPAPGTLSAPGAPELTGMPVDETRDTPAGQPAAEGQSLTPPPSTPPTASDTPDAGQLAGEAWVRTFECTIPITAGDGTQRECGQELHMIDGVVETCPVPHKPALRVVPNPDEPGAREEDQGAENPETPNTQGDASTMSAPTQQSTGEATNTQKAKEFADAVIKSGNEEWPAAVEAAKQQMGTVELTNDPDVVLALGAIEEAGKTLAAAGAQLHTALSTHDGATEQVSGLGAKAAKTKAYQNQ